MTSSNKREAQESPNGRQQQKKEDWEAFINLEGSDQTAEEAMNGEEERQPEAQVAPAPSSTTRRRPTKKPRRSKNSPEPDYSAMVQGQMAGTHRTGQACDRCKARKMKCDSNPTGCANCSASNSACTQTDPITRESYTRGELERLRADNQRLRQENQQLRQELERMRPPMGGITAQRPVAQSGVYGTTGTVGYSSLQGLGPQLLRQNTPVYPGTESIYATPRRPSLGGGGNGQSQFGPMAQTNTPTHGFQVPGSQDPFASNQSRSFTNGAPYASIAPVMRRTLSHGYNPMEANGRNNGFPILVPTQAPMTPVMRAPSGPNVVMPPQPGFTPPPYRGQMQPAAQTNRTPETKEEPPSPSPFGNGDSRRH
ncbi:hypothetical protein D8B26_003883 [Coccidioides posadasii str. Silveira]|uniref:Uncharacterized protein n=1 Tax=Coccidioides posadasii (strain RMSCC 757 / Silveira) TaxID=443226 RepID=E9D991_COCPS|nr:conserved hypothetical protein [Coccidioides posadasii str. Silveira]QVM09220.1 hypothetical protein D8B26_003883 [Coccidioides posadasii str. Silveira]